VAERHRPRRDLALAAAIAVVLAPLVVLAVRVAVDGAPAPAGDVGLIELRVRDVGGGHTPLLGSYSRFGFNQPGPLLLDVLAVPYRLLGGRFSGIEVGAVALNAVALVLVLLVAHRRGGRVALAGTAAVLAVFVHGCGPRWLADPWEPHVLVAPGLALLVVAFDAVAGRPWALPVAGALASLLAQATGTLLPFAVAMGGWAVVGVVVVGLAAARARSQGAGPPVERRRVAVAVGVTVAVVFVLWAPPLLEQLTHRPGNLTVMYRTLARGGPKLGLGDGWRAVALELSHRATWLGNEQRFVGLSGAVDVRAAPVVPVGAVALVVVGVAVAWRRRRAAALLVATVAVALIASTFAMSRLIGPVFAWIPQWLRLLGVATWLAVFAGVVALVPPAVRRRAAAVAVPVLAAVAVVASGVTAVAAAGDWREPDPIRDAVLHLAPAAAAAVSGAPAPVLVRSRLDTGQVFGGDDVAAEVLVLALERRGVATVVDADLANKFGPDRAHPARAVTGLLLVDADADAAAGAGTGDRLLATADAMRPADRRRRARLLAAAGLPTTATDAEVTRAIAADPSLRPRLLPLRELPLRPRIALLLAPAVDVP
jgi:hypothetical protein